MATYVIGDVQGCFDELQTLLMHIQYQPDEDTLWFVGDLVNRGPQSLATLEWIRAQPTRTVVVLGNHDLHCLACIENPALLKPSDTLIDVLNAPHVADIAHWLRQQHIVYADPHFNVMLSHAGVYPWWDQQQALAYGQELECILRGDQYPDFIRHLYGNEPAYWDPQLQGHARYRFICNAFTRMRFVSPEGALLLSRDPDSTDPRHANAKRLPWFAIANRPLHNADLVFGHWAALNGQTQTEHVYAVDTGCVWGNTLTALRMEDKQRFSVPSQQRQARD